MIIKHFELGKLIKKTHPKCVPRSTEKMSDALDKIYFVVNDLQKKNEQAKTVLADCYHTIHSEFCDLNKHHPLCPVDACEALGIKAEEL